MCSFVMWLALPPTHELAAPRELLVDADEIPVEGNARVLLGRFNRAQSLLPLPSLATCLFVELRASEVWRYDPPEGHDVFWMVVCTGSVDVGEPINEGELVIFDRSGVSVDVLTQGGCSVIIGSAPFSRQDLIERDSSVHTSAASLKTARTEILRIGEQLSAEGHLTTEQWEHAREKLRRWD
jgi:redox-sensitive bicupin YhaK (pirin superfamily)